MGQEEKANAELLLPSEHVATTLLVCLTAHPLRDSVQGDLLNKPLPVALERQKDARIAASPLKFPGKVPCRHCRRCNCCAPVCFFDTKSVEIAERRISSV